MAAALVARSFPDNTVSRLLVGRVCKWLLEKQGIHLSLSLEQVDELYKLAKLDEPRASRQSVGVAARPCKDSSRRRSLNVPKGLVAK